MSKLLRSDVHRPAVLARRCGRVAEQGRQKLQQTKQSLLRRLSVFARALQPRAHSPAEANEGTWH